MTDSRDSQPSIRLLFFAMAQELAGETKRHVPLEAETTVAALDARLREELPWLGTRLSSYRIAVDREFATGDMPVRPGAEVAIIPPVSGG